MSNQTKNKSANRGAFFNAEKRPSRNRENAPNHHELTTKKPSKSAVENANPNEKRP
ncbi:MAG: hypothetical protein ABSA39_09995 [Edaphobacter sp.]